MTELRDLRTDYDFEMRSLIREVEDLEGSNAPASFEQIAKYRAIAVSMLMARFRFDDAVRRLMTPHLNVEPELVDLRQFFTRAAIAASHEVRQ